MELKVAFYRGSTGALHKLIGAWTKSVHTHVELVLPEGARLGIRPWKEGVVKCWEEVDDEPHNWDHVPYIVTPDQLTRINEFYNETQGQPYDWVGVVGSHVLPYRVQQSGRWFCSQWVGRALDLAGIAPVPKEHELNPGRLFRYLHR